MKASPSDVQDAAHELPFRDELKRKTLHLLALVVPLGMALLDRSLVLAVLIPASLIALTGDVLRAYSEDVARLIQRLFGPLMRRDEWKARGSGFVVNGATWVLLSATLLTLVFPLRLAVPVFAMFMISDAAAAVVGRRFGRLRWGGTLRTVEGSLAFLVIGLFVIACFPSVPFWIGAFGVACGCVAEVLPRPLNDNLRVPLTVAAAIALLEWIVLGRPVDLFW